MTIDKANINSEFLRRGPWVSRWEVDGTAYGGSFDAINDGRVALFHQEFPDAKRVLELGSMEGGHSIAIARIGASVVGLEGRQVNIDRARFVADLYKEPNVEFRLANLESHQFDPSEKFDTIFCVGLLYHLPEPWALLKKLRAVSPRLFLWTHCGRHPAIKADRYLGTRYGEGGLGDPLSGMSAESFWPTESSLMEMLSDAGFGNVKVILNHLGHHGPEITLSCR